MDARLRRNLDAYLTTPPWESISDDDTPAPIVDAPIPLADVVHAVGQWMTRAAPGREFSTTGDILINWTLRDNRRLVAFGEVHTMEAALRAAYAAIEKRGELV